MHGNLFIVNVIPTDTGMYLKLFEWSPVWLDHLEKQRWRYRYDTWITMFALNRCAEVTLFYTVVVIREWASSYIPS